MTSHQHTLEARRAKYVESAGRLRSYVKEVTDAAERYGADAGALEADLSKARCDIEFYEEQARLIGEELREEAARNSFQIYEDSAGEWRWRLVAGNNRIIAVSGEGYRRRQDCLGGVELVRGAKDAPVEGGD